MLKSLTVRRPNTKPPMCAKYATPPPVLRVDEGVAAVDELEEEPDPEEDERRDLEEEERHDPRQHAASGKEDDVRAEDAAMRRSRRGWGSGRRPRAVTERDDRLRGRRREPPEDVEDEEAHASEQCPRRCSRRSRGTACCRGDGPSSACMNIDVKAVIGQSSPTCRTSSRPRTGSRRPRRRAGEAGLPPGVLPEDPDQDVRRDQCDRQDRRAGSGRCPSGEHGAPVTGSRAPSALSARAAGSPPGPTRPTAGRTGRPR